MNIHAIRENERAIKMVQRQIKKWDGIGSNAEAFQSRKMAENIVRNLKRNKIMKTYKP